MLNTSVALFSRNWTQQIKCSKISQNSSAITLKLLGWRGRGWGKYAPHVAFVKGLESHFHPMLKTQMSGHQTDRCLRQGPQWMGLCP